MRGAPAWAGMEELAHTLVYDLRIVTPQGAGHPLPAAWANAVTVPTLVMDGERSEEWMHHSVAALAALLPHSRRVTFPGADHGVAPDALVPVLTEFFGTQPAD